jgi:hypothetical protein
MKVDDRQRKGHQIGPLVPYTPSQSKYHLYVYKVLETIQVVKSLKRMQEKVYNLPERCLDDAQP